MAMNGLLRSNRLLLIINNLGASLGSWRTVIYLQRSPSRLKDEIWEPAVAFSWETNKQQTGRDKVWDKTETQQRGTKLKRNSVEARRRAKRGGKNCKRRKHNADTPQQIELPSWREETRIHGCSSLYTLWERPLTNSNLFATLSLTLKGWDMGASCRNSLTKTINARPEP